MATNTSIQSTINYLNFVTRELNRYIPLTLLILGTVGNILNIMVFTRPLFRANPCSIYFISGSVSNFLSLYIGLITPFLGLYNLDPTQTSNALCKIRFYLRFATITLSTWFILLACIDRFLSSSANANIRLWSSLRLAKRIICLAIIICFIFPYTQIFYCYSVSQKKACTYTTATCKSLSDIILFICNSGLPPLLMIIFSMLTIRHVKYSNRMTAGGRRDLQLIRILLIQVSILVSFAIPVAVQKMYSITTANRYKDPLTIAIESLANQISVEISYISNSTTFYIYSLTSKKYRQEVFNIFSLLFTGRGMKRNTVKPMGTTRLHQNELVRKTAHELYKPNIRNRNE